MASKKASAPVKQLVNTFRHNTTPQPARSMATSSSQPALTTSFTSTDPSNPQSSTPFQAQRNPFLTTAQCTLHTFPSFEPSSLIAYPSTHLLLPLRRDILHRAVIYEADNTRAGTANTKHRTEVHGSNRKVRPQKGTGRARLGDKKSPMLRGGGVAFGPKPRDFSTELPKRIYDLAWRTALSYRYRKGQLTLLANAADLEHVHAASRARYLTDLLEHNRMGNKHGRTLFVTRKPRESLVETLREGEMGRHALVVDVSEVDVKDLLELGRLVVERSALEWIFREHQSDLKGELKLSAWGDWLREDGTLGQDVREDPVVA